MGIGSCAASFVVWEGEDLGYYILSNERPGLSLWRDQLSFTSRDSQEAPEWCLHKHKFIVECYFKIQKNSQAEINYTSYRIDTHARNDGKEWPLVDQRKICIEDDIADKWRRYYGEAELLPVDRVLMAANAFFMLSAIVAFIGVFIGHIIIGNNCQHQANSSYI